MKLLFFINTLKGGGAERVLVNLTNELILRRHSITIALNENLSNYELDPRISIRFPEKRNWYSGNNFVLRAIRNLQMRLSFCQHTRRTIKEASPEIIITFMHCNLWPIILFHGNIPIIHSEHNAYDRKLGIASHFNRFLLNRFFDCVCVLSPFDQGFAKAKGLNNTIVMPNPNTFECITEEEYKRQFSLRKNIYICGRLNSWRIKGFDIAITAFGRIAHLFPNVDLDVIGGGDNGSVNYLKKLSAELGIENRVHFWGYQKDILNVIGQHKILLLSSRTEGFPMVVTEAMSQGVPCVAYERLASSIIVNKKDGYLVEDGSFDGLVDALQIVLSDSSFLYELGSQAIKNVTRFSPQSIADRWEKLMLGLLHQ